jgi:hypothetical protein
MQKVQRARRAAIYVAYDKRGDAAKLRVLVGAIRAANTGRPGRWTSQFEFWFDHEMYAKIVAATAARTAGSADGIANDVPDKIDLASQPGGDL